MQRNPAYLEPGGLRTCMRWPASAWSSASLWDICSAGRRLVRFQPCGRLRRRLPQVHPQTRTRKMPSLEDMKRMADKKAEPLLAKLKSDPNNSDLLNQIGTLYKATHQFKEAAGYFKKAIDADPKNVAARTDLASCLFYEGDADGAINQLQQSLRYDPKDANALFNLGMIRLQAKNDPSGAVTAWQQLLKLNPTLADEKKAAVQKLIAQARKPKASN